MLEELRAHQASRRQRPGDGRPLGEYRWWQLPGRALFHTVVGPTTYSVDVRHWQNLKSDETEAALHLDGRQRFVSTLPAVFPVDGGTIDVSMSGFGMKRCHYVAANGVERQLTPDPMSPEGRRARLEHDHPVVSRLIGFASVAFLLVGIALLVQQLAQPISEIPQIAESIGVFTPWIVLPLWLNITLAVGAAIASIERALRLRYSWLDSLAN